MTQLNFTTKMQGINDIVQKSSFDPSQIIQTVFVVTIVPLVLQSGNNFAKSLFDTTVSWVSHFWNYKRNKCSVRYIPYHWQSNSWSTELYDAVEDYLDGIFHNLDEIKFVKNHHLIFPEVNINKKSLTFRPRSGTSFIFNVDPTNHFKICAQDKTNKNLLEILIQSIVQQKQNETNANDPNSRHNQNNKQEEKHYEIKLIGSNDGDHLNKFIEHLGRLYLNKKAESYKLYSISNGNSFQQDLIWMKKNCTFDGVLMNDDLRHTIRENIRLFWDDEEHYSRISQPHRCSFFLVGKPGSGKTSFIRCIPAEIKNHEVIVQVLKFPSKSTNIMYDINQIFEKAKSVMASGCTKAIWIVEDIDCVSTCLGKRDVDDSEKQKHSAGLSAFLNAIDGIETPEHLMIIFTSNHPGSIDPALVRPGRMDTIYNFDHVTDIATLQRYGERFFSDLDGEYLPLPDFYQSLLDRKFTNASIVQIMKRYRNCCKIRNDFVDWNLIMTDFVDERTSNNLDQSIFVDLPN
jgi:hypothetical protein